MISTEISVLTEPDAVPLLEAVLGERGEAAWRRVAGFLQESFDGNRTIWVAKQPAERVAGMVTLRWRSDYPKFRQTPAAPEIVDLYVWQAARRQGVATRLLQQAETAAKAKRCGRIGLGVGVLAADAPAWGFYLRRGYAFDDTGGWWNGAQIAEDGVIDHAAAPVLLMMDKML